MPQTVPAHGNAISKHTYSMYAGNVIIPTPASGHFRRLRRDTSDACVGECPTLAK
ncbi:MAG: hypothetical protein LBS54_06420 [Dysgonamonadaceae bacterium]|nr:hypothetical protein [Dysgonamonadaceae bacterium]